MSLVELDAAGDAGEAVNAAHIHANTVLADAAGKLPGGHEVSVTWPTAAPSRKPSTDLEWDDGEILIVGSSRLAQKNSMFLGSTANKVLRALPVPMVVVPRDYERVGQPTNSDPSTERERALKAPAPERERTDNALKTQKTGR